ncbi:MAG TPA: class I SAM-dependent methyltransferase [Vicinamibacteria bacterium]|jgi:SAM-dependent methyltransferase
MTSPAAGWRDDDAFWEAMEPALCAPGRLRLAEGDVAGIAASTELREGARVLDLGCGPGAHALGFAARGCRVTGVDRTRRLLDRAKSAGRQRRLEVEWIQADMREFRRPCAFDLACSLYTSFGYFDDHDNRRVLENVVASLAPAGAFVLDLITQETVARRWRDGAEFEIDGVQYRERRRLSEDGSALLADWMVVFGDVRRSFRVRQRLYMATELEALLGRVGFRDIRLCGSLDGKASYDEAADRLVVIALARRNATGPAPAAPP